MRKSELVLILAVFLLAGLAVSSLYKAATVYKANTQLTQDITGLSVKVTGLEQDNVDLETQLNEQKNVNTELTSEKKALAETLESVQVRMEEIEAELGAAKEELAKINGDFEILKDENQNLLFVKRDLETKIEALNQERESLQERFNSLDELKKAMRQLKLRKYQYRLDSKKKINPQPPPPVVSQIKPEITVQSEPVAPQAAIIREPQEQEAEGPGNQGYIVRDGKPTFGLDKQRIKIEVLPVN